MATQAPAPHLPLLSGTPLLGNLREMQQNRLGMYKRLARTCGDAGRIRFGPYRITVLNTPEMAQAVLVDHAADFDKGMISHRTFKPVAGNGLINNEGASHRKQRKLVAPVFTHRRLGAYGDTMVRYTEQVQAEWREGDVIRIDKEMARLTMSIVGKTLFDAEVFTETGELGAAVTTAMQYMQYSITHILPLPLSWPDPRSRRTRAALALIDSRIHAMIAERRRSGEERDDFLSILLRSRDEAGEGMSDTQIRDEAVTLFLAGHETTANTLSWCYYFLASNPGVVARLEQEADTVLGGRPATWADLPNLPYALQVFKEALRLYPPADALTRTALHDVDVGPYHLHKNSIVIIPIYTIHRRPECYPDPERFDPQRFTPENEKRLPRHAFMPFGAGPRVCIGNHFALMEGQLVLATLAQHVRFELVPGQKVEPEPVFVIRQKRGCRLIVHRRAPRMEASIGSFAGAQVSC